MLTHDTDTMRAEIGGTGCFIGCLALRDAPMTDPQVDRTARLICAEQSAFWGEPPCWAGDDPEWPNPRCDEPGCMALAQRIVNEFPAQPVAVMEVPDD